MAAPVAPLLLAGPVGWIAAGVVTAFIVVPKLRKEAVKTVHGVGGPVVREVKKFSPLWYLLGIIALLRALR